MRLPDDGMDIFYIDESMNKEVFAMSAIAIPFLRKVEGTWTFIWEDQLQNFKLWKRLASHDFGIPIAKEFKGSKLLSGRGRFVKGKRQLRRAEARDAYATMLQALAILPNRSIITVTGTNQSNLYGHSKLEALLYALLQRMRTACKKTRRAGMVFFDEGHGEYRTLYRKARIYLPTGSMRGGWGPGESSRNMPLDNFIKDGNLKDSRFSLFIQAADLVAYAAYLKIRGEQGTLPQWQKSLAAGTLYDEIPRNVLNTAASTKDAQGIVRLPSK